MRLQISRSKNSESFYVVRSVYEKGKKTTIVYEKLGTLQEVREKAGGKDPYEWAKGYVAQLTAQEKEGQENQITTELLLRQQFQLLLIPRPLEPLLRQTLVQQHISRSIPIQRLDPIRPTTAEQENGCLVQFLPELQFHHGSQPVDLLPHVGVPAGNVVILNPAEVKHGGSAPLPSRRRPPCCFRLAGR